MQRGAGQRPGFARKPTAGAGGYGAGKQHQRKPPAPLRRGERARPHLLG
jgi:hypothetical protein